MSLERSELQPNKGNEKRNNADPNQIYYNVPEPVVGDRPAPAKPTNAPALRRGQG